MKTRITAAVLLTAAMLTACGSTANTGSPAAAANDTQQMSAAVQSGAPSESASSKTESSKVESSKVESSKVESSKAESSKAESSIAEAPKATFSKAAESVSGAPPVSQAPAAQPQQEEQPQEQNVVIIEDAEPAPVEYEITPPDDPDGTLGAMLDAVNAERGKAGVPALQLDKAMCDAAAKRAEEIIDVTDHVRPDGSACYTALSEYGVSCNAAAENLSMGRHDAAEIVAELMNSDVHRANILNPAYSRLGVGVCVREGTLYGIYWVQEFAD